MKGDLEALWVGLRLPSMLVLLVLAFLLVEFVVIERCVSLLTFEASLKLNNSSQSVINGKSVKMDPRKGGEQEKLKRQKKGKDYRENGVGGRGGVDGEEWR